MTGGSTLIADLQNIKCSERHHLVVLFVTAIIPIIIGLKCNNTALDCCSRLRRLYLSNNFGYTIAVHCNAQLRSLIFSSIPGLAFRFHHSTIPPLRKKCPYSEFFWSVYSHIRSEYGDLRSKYPYSLQMRKIRTRKTPNTDTFHAVIMSPILSLLLALITYSSRVC